MGIPLPNAPAGPFGARTYETSSKVSTDYDQFSVRLDQTLSSKSQLFGRFSYNQITGPVTNPDQTAINPSFGIQFFDHQRSADLSYARQINPHLTLQANLGYIRSTPNFPAANHTQPGILFGDGLFEGYGAPAGSIFGSYGNLYQFRFNMTGVRGNHAMKWGAEIRINRDTTVFGTAPNGAYSFGGGTAYSPVAIQSLSGQHNINVGDPLPDSLTGLLTATPYSYNISLPAEFTPVGSKFDAAGVRRQAYNFYFQDAWKATSRLTLSYGLRYEVDSRIAEATKRTSLPEFFANGQRASYWDHQANMIFVVNPQPPYQFDWNGWGPRLAADYALAKNTVVHAGGAITTGLMNLWQENFLTASVPYLFNPFITAQPGSAVPFQNSVAVIPLPPAYDISGNLIFPNGQSTDAKPNTVMDLQRYQDAVAAEVPGHQAQLPALSAVANNFRNGYIASWTLSVEHNFGDFDATVAYVGTAGIHLALCLLSQQLHRRRSRVCSVHQVRRSRKAHRRRQYDLRGFQRIAFVLQRVAGQPEQEFGALGHGSAGQLHLLQIARRYQFGSGWIDRRRRSHLADISPGPVESGRGKRTIDLRRDASIHL